MLRFIKGTPSASKANYEYKMMYSFDKRKNESDRVRREYPDRVPVIIEKADKSTIQQLNKTKYLIQKSPQVAA